jgi:hypothetical protein
VDERPIASRGAYKCSLWHSCKTPTVRRSTATRSSITTIFRGRVRRVFPQRLNRNGPEWLFVRDHISRASQVIKQSVSVQKDTAALVVLTLSKSSNHKSRIGPTSARLTLALVSLVEHVSQNIIVAVFIHMVDAYVSVFDQLSLSTPRTRSISG